MITRGFYNIQPLTPNRLARLSPGAVRPEGWLRKQTDLLTSGFYGTLRFKLDELGACSCWLGGEDRDLRLLPEYLYGAYPLAVISGDSELREYCENIIRNVIASQREDGSFGPEFSGMVYPRVMMAAAVRYYFLYTAEKDALRFIDSFLKWEYQYLRNNHLEPMAAVRSSVNLDLALWLYNVTGQKYLYKLCQKIRSLSVDWTDYFHIFPVIRAMGKQHPYKVLKKQLKDEDRNEEDEIGFYTREYMMSQGVNVAWGLSDPSLINLFKSGYMEKNAFEDGYKKLMKYHGTATGMFTCDSALAGCDPSAGIALNAISALVDSITIRIALGEEASPELSQMLEKVVFNPLAAAFNEDMTAIQHVQQVNQIQAGAVDGWYDMDSDINAFTNVPYDKSIAVNSGLGWVRYVQNLWYSTKDGGLHNISYAPCTVDHMIDGVHVRLSVGGSWPFTDTVKISVSCKKPVEFPVYLPVPLWADEAIFTLPNGEMLQMKGGETACVKQLWNGGETITLTVPREARLIRLPHRSAAIEYGPLLMALGLASEEDKGILKCRDDWKKALVNDQIKTERSESEPGFFGAECPVNVLARMNGISNWPASSMRAALPPADPEPVMDDTLMAKLVPYGMTKLRIAQFPIFRSPSGN